MRVFFVVSFFVSAGLSIGCLAWAAVLAGKLNRTPGAGLFIVAAFAAGYALGAMLITRPRAPLDFFGRSAWKQHRS